MNLFFWTAYITGGTAPLALLIAYFETKKRGLTARSIFLISYAIFGILLAVIANRVINIWT